jgi:hypothetical protein
MLALDRYVEMLFTISTFVELLQMTQSVFG